MFSKSRAHKRKLRFKHFTYINERGEPERFIGGALIKDADASDNEGNPTQIIPVLRFVHLEIFTNLSCDHDSSKELSCDHDSSKELDLELHVPPPGYEKRLDLKLSLQCYFLFISHELDYKSYGDSCKAALEPQFTFLSVLKILLTEAISQLVLEISKYHISRLMMLKAFMGSVLVHVQAFESTYGPVGGFSVDELSYQATKFLNFQDDIEGVSDSIPPSHEKGVFQLKNDLVTHCSNAPYLPTLVNLTTTNSGYDFFNNSSGQDPDTTYAIVLYRSDTRDSIACGDCVNTSIVKLREVCPEFYALAATSQIRRIACKLKSIAVVSLLLRLIDLGEGDSINQFDSENLC
ncbi:hypothetical protein L2E82_33740 [Cichorium intybus]|uniref:Uncharacterized protein n=1 Tax=Cichorium intybus TaxID=13427 RepID=A0ACB9BL00_CICIN|nr:hypothetical protein L2E82_33740 [Cichorium intybus]